MDPGDQCIIKLQRAYFFVLVKNTHVYLICNQSVPLGRTQLRLL